ncbi:DNA primase [Roseivivax sp. THAF40]|uniref:DNA primase n=1 Tax=unclassified Roseivivax TaxID=2639302 RepID=UPI0012686793|nr:MULTISPECIES: DNA primase [unclassified Roseivivax]QFS83851.1 DNA primase [Roseivivax sp. THAF197b]QFT47683.1 DNA primase [Roseivivax sp. THAF40]
MSLPPGFLDELRTRTSLVQVVGRKVMWDKHKSNQAKGDMWAPCPFHQEKSASFHVDDRKGFFYCFGCQAKGDAITFVKDSENVGFMEAVEILATEAGMQMPARDPRAQEKADRRTELARVMEDAVRFYRMQLKTGAAAAARDYLAGRALDAAALERFEIGFAPEGWQTLWDHLTGKGIAPDLILGAGLAKPSNKGGKPYDVFRNRILFPIRDGRGRAIAFGGRAMDPEDKAKYLNSPETDLFDKGRNLYNLAPAREAAGKGQPLIVAEGYMDVIALSRAGFEASVAPLGTAVTETQLQLLWRVSDEPIIALDGDKAGLRAAHRVIDLALPLLEAGKSLRFALMPEGQDPDDLLRADGPEAVARVLEQALPMVQLLWRRETEGRVFDSPERKAALDRALREKIAQIQDPSLRHHYGAEIKELRYQLFRPQRASSPQGGGGGAGRVWRAKGAPEPPSAATKASLLVAAGPEGERRIREAVILATLISSPAIIEEFDAALEVLDFADADHAALCAALLRAEPQSREAARDAAAAAIGGAALETMLAARHVAITPCLRKPEDLELARLTVAEELAKLDAARGLAAEIAEAVEEAQETGSETRTWRLGQAAAVRAQAERAVQEDDTDYETGANGALIDRAERKSFAELLDNITFAKGRNSG